MSSQQKLLSFFEGKYDQPEAATAVRYPLCTEKTVAASQSLRDASVPNQALVAKWVDVSASCFTASTARGSLQQDGPDPLDLTGMEEDWISRLINAFLEFVRG